MRRVHLRHHPNILKRLLVHVAAFNLGLVMRKLLGRGTPPGLQGDDAALFLTLLRLLREAWASPRASKEYANPRSLSEIDFDSYQGKGADCCAAEGCSY